MEESKDDVPELEDPASALKELELLLRGAAPAALKYTEIMEDQLKIG